MLDPRFKKAFFQNQTKADEAVKSLLDALKLAIQNDEDEAENTEPGNAASDGPSTSSGDSGTADNLSIQHLMKKALENSLYENTEATTPEEVLNEYMNSPLIQSGCLKFWKDYETKADGNKVKKALSKLARKVLTPPPTSTDVERLFSTAANILTEKRNRLLPVNVEKLLFLKSNMELCNYQLEKEIL